ncbi:MAG: hypothetical protein EOO40_11850 [Deltaproteobacteria bacterium]|nr:MAG: hypothetical protein EOO40_11850 [Deltaproteobacteria bacterium]
MSWFTKLVAHLPDPNRLAPWNVPPAPAHEDDDTMQCHCADLRAMLRLQRLYRAHVEGVLQAPDFRPDTPRTMGQQETPLSRYEYRRMASFLRGESSRTAAHIEACQRVLAQRCGDMPPAELNSWR